MNRLEEKKLPHLEIEEKYPSSLELLIVEKVRNGFIYSLTLQEGDQNSSKFDLDQISKVKTLKEIWKFIYDLIDNNSQLVEQTFRYFLEYILRDSNFSEKIRKINLISSKEETNDKSKRMKIEDPDLEKERIENILENILDTLLKNKKSEEEITLINHHYFNYFFETRNNILNKISEIKEINDDYKYKKEYIELEAELEKLDIINKNTLDYINDLSDVSSKMIIELELMKIVAFISKKLEVYDIAILFTEVLFDEDDGILRRIKKIREGTYKGLLTLDIYYADFLYEVISNTIEKWTENND